MKPYLLPLSTLHAAAPGALDAVFGPDGDFEGAPDWIGQVWCWSPAWGPESHAATFRPVFSVYPHAVGHENYSGSTRFEHAAFDLRVTSVADRLRRLCECALGGALYEMGEFGGTTLRCGDEILACWAADGSPTSPIDSEPVRFPAIGRDWLGPLVLALAPQIATLARPS